MHRYWEELIYQLLYKKISIKGWIIKTELNDLKLLFNQSWKQKDTIVSVKAA